MDGDPKQEAAFLRGAVLGMIYKGLDELSQGLVKGMRVEQDKYGVVRLHLASGLRITIHVCAEPE